MIMLVVSYKFTWVPWSPCHTSLPTWTHMLLHPCIHIHITISSGLPIYIYIYICINIYTYIHLIINVGAHNVTYFFIDIARLQHGHMYIYLHRWSIDNYAHTHIYIYTYVHLFTNTSKVHSVIDVTTQVSYNWKIQLEWGKWRIILVRIINNNILGTANITHNDIQAV